MATPPWIFEDENLRNPWHIAIIEDTKVMEFWVSFFIKLWVRFWVNIQFIFLDDL
jgi:hypothetical protein